MPKTKDKNTILIEQESRSSFTKGKYIAHIKNIIIIRHGQKPILERIKQVLRFFLSLEYSEVMVRSKSEAVI